MIRAVDGPLVNLYGLRPESVAYNGVAEVLQPVWIAARSSLCSVFECATIADLASGTLPRAGTALERRGRLVAALTCAAGFALRWVRYAIWTFN